MKEKEKDQGCKMVKQDADCRPSRQTTPWSRDSRHERPNCNVTNQMSGKNHCGIGLMSTLRDFPKTLMLIYNEGEKIHKEDYGSEDIRKFESLLIS